LSQHDYAAGIRTSRYGLTRPRIKELIRLQCSRIESDSSIVDGTLELVVENVLLLASNMTDDALRARGVQVVVVADPVERAE
jgi:hypothetical protein